MDTTPTDSEYLTVDEYAAAIRMKPEWVRRQCKAGAIPMTTKLGGKYRIHRDSVALLMSKTQVETPRPGRGLSARQRRRAAVTPP